MTTTDTHTTALPPERDTRTRTGTPRATGTTTRLSENHLANYWTKVDTTAGPDGCWEWTASKSQGGYGRVKYGTKTMRSHRLAWEIDNNQAIPAGLQINHHCDNRGCCNPAHLYLGTQLDNMRDMWARGQASHSGEDNPGAKLTADQVIAIREARAAGAVQRRLAAEYGVDRSTIYQVVNNIIWKHVGGPLASQ